MHIVGTAQLEGAAESCAERQPLDHAHGYHQADEREPGEGRQDEDEGKEREGNEDDHPGEPCGYQRSQWRPRPFRDEHCSGDEGQRQKRPCDHDLEDDSRPAAEIGCDGVDGAYRESERQ